MDLNFLALVVTALVPLLVGFVWYHPKVFGNAWMKAAGVTEDQAKTGNMAMIFGLTFVFSFILAYGFNVIAIHDNFIGGAMYYATNGTMNPEPGSELAKWFEYYQTNLAASNHTFKHGAFHGFLLGGILISLPVIAVNALFERKGFKYIAINAGFWILCLTIMGGIVAAWR